MAMPRPTGKALEIAEKVVPGLRAFRSGTKPDKTSSSHPKASLSKVEIEQTELIET